MSAGAAFHTHLNKRIRAATAVLVLWSRSSIDSQWVVAEAQKGLELGKLVAVTFDRDITKEMPMPFNGIQTPDLSDWIENGSKADHPGWQSVLNAIGDLFNRPLAEIATILEAGTPETKADFVRNHPNDAFAANLAAELKASKLYEFEQQANRLKHLAEKQLANEIRRMNQLRSQLAGMIDAALAAGTYPKFDVKHEIHRVLNPYDADQSPEAVLGKRGRKALVEEVARMRSEIGDLRNAAAATENAKAESEGQKLVIADLEKQVRQSSRPATWLMAAAAILGVGVAWLAIDRFSRSDLIPVTVADAELKKVQDQFEAVARQLEASNAEKRRLSDMAASLSKQNDDRSNQLTSATANLQNASKALDSTKKQLDTATQTVASLTKERNELLEKFASATANLGKATADLDTLNREFEAANGSVDTLTKEKKQLSEEKKQLSDQFAAASAKLTGEKQKLADQLGEVNSKFDTAAMRITSLSQQLTASQNADAARTANEARCDELAAYDTDPDLPANAKRPADQTKLGATPQEAIESCLAALSALPKQVTRRILVQLARGYIRQGHSSRSNNQALATSSYTTAIILNNFASWQGSVQADELLGYIFGGNFNRSNYVLPNTPEYSYAMQKLEASAAAKHPYGLLYAGSYLVWPGCSQNVLIPAPEKGLQYIREAQEKKVAAAYYAEGYYWYFGAPGVKNNTDRALNLFDKARKLNFTQAEAFFGKSPPPKPNTLCPTEIF
jgi:predicted  nucleic acid-binding Zn-ribbon protein